MTTRIPERNCDISQPIAELNHNEKVKSASRFLRGTIEHGLETSWTSAFPGDDPLLLKFHGIYQQDNRDLRADRKQRKLEPNYQFMVRLRIPGGMLTREQWLGLDNISGLYSERGIRITTRQTIQLHGIRKWNLKIVLATIKSLGLDTIAACGDDCRGVVCGTNPELSIIHKQVFELAKKTSETLIPKTKAYSELWLDESPRPRTVNEDPLYGSAYLPRKFKVGYIIPPINDIDIYAQDIGFIAIVNDGLLDGFNVCVGGGMGKIDNREDSYPRLAETIGSIAPHDAPMIAETAMAIQRDFGNRKDRHQARFKYTLDRLGTPWFIKELEYRTNKKLQTPVPFTLTHNGDQFGWQQDSSDNWIATLHINNGRIDGSLKEKFRSFLHYYGGRLRLTANQNLQLVDIGQHEKAQIQWRLEDIGLGNHLLPDKQESHTISCVALPTCGLAMAEAERYSADFIDRLNQLKLKNGVSHIPIVTRITGCPNGCARPYLAEIALTGRAPGIYNLYLGGSFNGNRLATLEGTNLNENQIFETLDRLINSFANQREENEYFGDFFVRTKSLELISNIKIQGET